MSKLKTSKLELLNKVKANYIKQKAYKLLK